VSLRTGLNDVEKKNFLALPGLEPRSICRPARGQSLYRLLYPGSYGNPILQNYDNRFHAYELYVHTEGYPPMESTYAMLGRLNSLYFILEHQIHVFLYFPAVTTE
jgi:hypothetical protein